LSQGAQSVFVPAYKKGLKVLDGEQLLSANFPPRSLMLAPWLLDKGLAMIFAPRGVGKTWIALSIAHAIASGTEFLRWKNAAGRWSSNATPPVPHRAAR
jgi:AAA domain